MFPSFHMALAILFTWGFWRIPVARWIALALNVAMAAATPLSGGHYFVDLIAGAVVALVCIAGVSWAHRIIDRISRREMTVSDVPLPAGQITGQVRIN